MSPFSKYTMSLVYFKTEGISLARIIPSSHFPKINGDSFLTAISLSFSYSETIPNA